MKNNKNIILVICLTIIMFFLSLFYVENSICCMFHSARERGFPVRVLLISKTTSFLDEAQKIYLLNDIELLKQGWKLKLGSAWDSAYINIPINFIFYFTISYGLIFIFERLKRIYKK